MGIKYPKRHCIWTPSHSEEPEKVTEICTNLCKKFTDDETYVEYELEHFGSQVLCLELEPEHIPGNW